MKEFKDSEIVYENNQSDKVFAIIGKNLSEGLARTKDADALALYRGWSDSFPSYGIFKRRITTRKSSPSYQKEIEEWSYRVNKLLSDRRIETYSALAHLLGTGFGSVYNWAVGKYPPSRKFRRAIENLEIQYLKNSLSLWQRIKAGLRVVKG